MKLTSKILIFSVAAAACLAFFSPAILLSNTQNKEINKETPVTISRMVENDTIDLPSFSSIKVAGWYYSSDTRSGSAPIIKVIETERISSPRIIINRSWKGNASFEVKDSTLHVAFPMAILDSDTDTDRMLHIPDNNMQIAAIEVPPHDLKSLDSDVVPLHLNGFRDAILWIPANTRFAVDSCSFKSINLSTN